MTTFGVGVEVHPSALVTTNVYVPADRPDTVVLVPLPLEINPPGFRINVQVPVEGSPFRTTLPEGTMQVRFVIVPTMGASGIALTVNTYVATPAVHNPPTGLLVVTVIVISFPASSATGVYVNTKGDVDPDTGLKVPAPFSVKVIFVALPLKVLPGTVTGAVLHLVPVLLLRVTFGGLIQPHVTVKIEPAVVHPAAFLTERKWPPLFTRLKMAAD